MGGLDGGVGQGRLDGGLDRVGGLNEVVGKFFFSVTSVC